MRTSNVTDNDISSACVSAKKREWTIKEAAKSVNMEVPAFRSRWNGLKKKFNELINSLEEKGKHKSLSDSDHEMLAKTKRVLDIFQTCFKDGRSVSSERKTPEQTVNMISDLFADLDVEIEDTQNGIIEE